MSEDLVSALLEAERDIQSAMLAGDVAALDRLIDDRLIAIGPDGQVVTKAMDLQAHRERQLILTVLTPHDLQHVVADRTGVTCLVTSLEGTNGGEPFAVDMRYTRTWTHDGSRWRILAAHISFA